MSLSVRPVEPEIHSRPDQSGAMHNRTHSYGVLLLVSIAGAFITALAFIVVAQLSLPPSDLACGQSIAATLGDPFVRTIAGPVAFASGLLASPLLYFCLRRRRLAVTLPMVFGSVLTTVALITPFSRSLGFFSAYAALIISCIVCTRMKTKLFHLPTMVAALLLSALVVSCASNERRASSPESVAKRAEELSLQQERIEQLAIRSPHSPPDFLSWIHAGRVAWTNYLHADQKVRANFAANGIVMDARYYRLQEQLLETFSRQWQQIEDSISYSSNRPQALSPEPATIPANQANGTEVGKALDAPATNGPSAKQKLTGAEVVEIVRQHVVKAAPAAKFEIGSPQFTAGKWSVFVSYLPLGPGRHVYYELSAEGEILDRRGGY